MNSEYLDKNTAITREMIQEMCGFSKQQARSTLDKMQKEGLIVMEGKAKATHYLIMKLNSIAIIDYPKNSLRINMYRHMADDVVIAEGANRNRRYLVRK